MTEKAKSFVLISLIAMTVCLAGISIGILIGRNMP